MERTLYPDDRGGGYFVGRDGRERYFNGDGPTRFYYSEGVVAVDKYSYYTVYNESSNPYRRNDVVVYDDWYTWSVVAANVAIILVLLIRRIIR